MNRRGTQVRIGNGDELGALWLDFDGPGADFRAQQASDAYPRNALLIIRSSTSAAVLTRCAVPWSRLRAIAKDCGADVRHIDIASRRGAVCIRHTRDPGESPWRVVNTALDSPRSYPVACGICPPVVHAGVNAWLENYSKDQGAVRSGISVVAWSQKTIPESMRGEEVFRPDEPHV